MRQLQKIFGDNFREGREKGASVSVWQHGHEILCLAGGEAIPGQPWQPDTLVPIYSATKTAAAACLLLALYDCCQGPELEIGDIWTSFPAPRCTIGQFLSHQAGLAALSSQASIFDLEACRRAIESTSPAWAPPRHGYHPHTYGPILDILMLELTGQRTADFWEGRIRQPLGLDFYIGHLPETTYPRIARLHAARLHGAMPRSPFYAAFFDKESAIYRAFHSITGLESAREMNTPAAWQCGSPAKGGVASARGMAMFYQSLLGQLPGTPFPPEVLGWMSAPQSSGMDLTLLQPTSFTCGAMYAPTALFGRGGFGHAGAGGSHAFCEPETGLSFAYAMNQMELGILPSLRVQRLIDALMKDTEPA